MGNEFTVNTYEDNWQDQPELVTFADGSFLISWRSFFFDTDTYYVAAQLYDKFGQAVGGERVLDASEGSASEINDMARLADGGFVVTFSFSFDGLLDQDETYAKVYNADMSVRKSAFRVDTLPTFQTLGGSVAPLSNGGFMVVFGYDGVDTSALKGDFDDIYAQRYTKNGTKIGGNFRLNTKVNDFDQNAPESVQLKNGNTLVIWHSEASFPTAGDLDSNEIRGSLFSGTGKLLRSDFSIADAEGTVGDGIDPYNMCALNNGGFALARYETVSSGSRDYTYDVKLRLFNGSGSAASQEITVTKATRGIIYDIDVTQLATGEIVVVWQTPSTTDFPYDDVLGKVFDSSGRALSGTFNIAQNTTLAQEEPKIDALAGGGFVVTYMSEQADADHDGIAARIFGRGTAAADNVTVDATGYFAGFAGDDKIGGNKYANELYGGSGDDELWGRGGNDLLDGGKGSDTFYFTANLNTKTNVDRVGGFTHGLDDIALSKSVFAAIGDRLTKSEFQLGLRANDANNFIIYDKAKGYIYYDPDGDGTAKQTLFADLKNGTVLDVNDFLMV